MRAVNSYLLELDSPMIEKIKLSGGLELYLQGQYGEKANWNVTTQGRVSYKPISVHNVEIGDDVAISYRVVAKKIYPNNSSQFYPSKEGEFWQEYWTGTGWYIKILCMKGTTNNKVWTGFILNPKGELMDGFQGNESDMERWKSQFPFGNKTKFIYANLVEIDGKVYWKAGRADILAKKEGDKIVSVSDRIICKPLSVDLTQRYNIVNGVHLPDNSVHGVYNDRGTVVCNAQSAVIKEGDVVAFPMNLVEKYTLWGEDYYLIQKKFVHSIL